MSTTYNIDRSYSLEKITLEVPKSLNNVSNAPAMFTLYENSTLKNQVKNSVDKDLSLFLVINEIVLFHSIDEISNSGYMTITDSKNLIQTLPIFGWERVHIKFSITNSDSNTTTKTNNTDDPDKSADANNSSYDIYERYFYIYAIDNIRELGETKIYTIRFTSLATLVNIATRIEKRYTGKAEDILEEISNIDAFKIDKLNVEYSGTESNDFPMDKSGQSYNTCFPIRKTATTEFDHDVVCPAWRPFSFIRNIVEKSVSKDGLFTDCFLFQQTDGIYEFTDYQKMVDTKSNIVEFHYMPWVGNTNDTGIPKTNEKYTIKSYTMSKLFDVQMQCVTGTTGGITKVLDFASGLQQDFILYYTPTNNTSNLSQLSTYESPSSLVKGEKQDLNIATAGGKVTDVVELNINAITNKYKMTEKDANMLTAYKQSPFEKIRVKITGADTSSFDKNRRLNGSPASAMFTPDRKNEIQKKYAMNEPANAIMRVSEIILELNPCTDLKLGQCIKIDMKSNNETEPMINGFWYIANIKYILTYSEIKVYVTCFRNNMVIIGDRNV